MMTGLLIPGGSGDKTAFAVNVVRCVGIVHYHRRAEDCVRLGPRHEKQIQSDLGR